MLPPKAVPFPLPNTQQSQSSNRRVRNRSPGPESEDDRDLPSDHEGTLAADKATKDPPQKPPCTHKALHKPRPAPSRTEDSESTGEDDPIEPESNDEDLLVPEDYEKKKRKSSKALSKKKSAEKPLLPLSDLQLHDADEKPSEKSPDALPDCEKKRSEKCPAEPHHDEKPPEKRSPMIPPEPHQAERTKTRIRIPPRPRVFYQRFARKEFMPEEQQAQYWYEKSYISMMEQDRLHDSVAHLEMTVAKLRSLLDEETHRSEVSRQNYLKEMTQLDSKIQDLHAIHIKSVNSVDTGLEPITDQAFQTRFRTLQDDVNEWSRKSFKHKGERIELEDVDDVLKEILSPRFKRTKDLSFSLLMDSIAWAFMESRIFCLWFPGMSEEWQGKMEYLEGFVRGGGTSIDPTSHTANR